MSLTQETKNAVIAGVVLAKEDHGLLTAWLQLDYGGTRQGFGGYCLYVPKRPTIGKTGNFSGHFIWRCMEIAGVMDWDKLKGKTIRVKCDHNKVYAIGHIVKDDWFSPEEDFKEV